MLAGYMDQLRNTIAWAHYQDDIDSLYLARDSMQQLMQWVDLLPKAAQQQACYAIDSLLPMEWPLWMEACRFDDGSSVASENSTFH